MAQYVYRSKDGHEQTLSYPIGEAPDTVEFDDGTTGYRVLAWSGGFSLKGAGWASKPGRETANRKWGPQ